MTKNTGIVKRRPRSFRETPLGTSCRHLGTMLERYWRCLGKLLGPCWEHVGAMYDLWDRYSLQISKEPPPGVALAWLVLLPPQTAERGREAPVRWLLLLAGSFRQQGRQEKRRGVKWRGENVVVGRQLSLCLLVLALLAVLARSLCRSRGCSSLYAPKPLALPVL